MVQGWFEDGTLQQLLATAASTHQASANGFFTSISTAAYKVPVRIFPHNLSLLKTLPSSWYQH
jgi:hypothetical protein